MSYFNLQGLQGQERDNQKKANRLFASFQRKFCTKVPISETKDKYCTNAQFHKILWDKKPVEHFHSLKAQYNEDIFNRFLKNFKEHSWFYVNLKGDD